MPAIEIAAVNDSGWSEYRDSFAIERLPNRCFATPGRLRPIAPQ
jgi:hypothetical protein